MLQCPTFSAVITLQSITYIALLSQSLVSDRECNIPNQCHVSQPRSPWSYFRNESRCLIQFFLGYHMPFKAQYSLLGSSMVCRHVSRHLIVAFSSGEYVTPALVGSWQWPNVVNFPGLAISKLQPSLSIPGKFDSHGLFDCGKFFTYISDMRDDRHGQVHSLITSPSVCCNSP